MSRLFASGYQSIGASYMNVIYTDASDRIFPVFSFFFRGVVVVWPCHVAYGISVPRPGTEAGP